MSVLDRTIAHGFAPRMAGLGFVRRHHRWNRRKGLRVQAVDLQLSSHNTHLGGRLTVNLGVGLRLRTGGWMRAEDCDGWVRIGLLCPDRHDRWYGYDPRDADSVAAALEAALGDIEAHALPWLDSWRAVDKGSAIPRLLLRLVGMRSRKPVMDGFRHHR